MIEPRIEELIQHEIDGQNPPEESAQLSAILQSDATARAHFERLQAMAQEIHQVGLATPPIGLRDEIQHGIDASSPNWAARPPRRTRRAFSSREVLSFASGLAAGVVIFAILGRGFSPGESLDPATLGGSMVLNPHAAVMPVMDRRTIVSDDLRAEVLVRSDPDFVVAELDLRSPGQLDMVLEFDSSALALVGCERPAAEAGELLLGSDRLSMSDAGDGPYRFVFRKRVESASNPLQLRLNRGAWSARESLGIVPPSEASPG